MTTVIQKSKYFNLSGPEENLEGLTHLSEEGRLSFDIGGAFVPLGLYKTRKLGGRRRLLRASTIATPNLSFLKIIVYALSPCGS